MVREMLIGRTVTAVTTGEAGLFIAFDDEWELTITNPVQVAGASAAALLGEKLATFSGSETQERLGFGSGAELVVDLRPDAWSGPEAMQLRGPNQLIVVWN